MAETAETRLRDLTERIEMIQPYQLSLRELYKGWTLEEVCDVVIEGRMLQGADEPRGRLYHEELRQIIPADVLASRRAERAVQSLEERILALTSILQSVRDAIITYTAALEAEGAILVPLVQNPGPPPARLAKPLADPLAVQPHKLGGPAPSAKLPTG